MPGFPLTGVDPNDPIPGIIREIRFQQGATSGSGNSRPTVLLANCTSGSTTVDAAGTPLNSLIGPLSDEQDCINHAGYRSEALLMYRKYVAVDPDAPLYLILVPEGSSATASTCTLTVTASPGPGATAVAAAAVTLLGETVEAAVQTGDTPATIAANLATAINNQIFWPVTAAVGIAPNTHVITITAANKGPRGDDVLRTLRARLLNPNGISIAKSAITSGAVDDDFSAAYDELANAEIYYQVSAKTATGAVSAADHGVGQHAEFVKAQALPTVGKGAIAIFGLVGDAATAATVGLTVNNVRVVLYHAINAEWTPAMIAAHYGAAKRSREIAHPGANLRNYGLRGNDVSQLPDPFMKSDRLTKTEMRSDLNNGVTPIGHTNTGQAFIVRQITAACQTNAVYDYRAREGHIPSCTDYFWDSVNTSYASQMQDFVADDLKPGQKPLQNVEYPSGLRAIINTEIDRAITFNGGPYLDPSVQDEMKAATVVVRLPDGLSARTNPVAVKHNNKGQFLILESSEAY